MPKSNPCKHHISLSSRGSVRSITRCQCIWLLALMLIAPLTFAEQATVPNLAQSLVQVFAALLFIVTLIFLAAWLAKKFKFIHSAGTQKIRALAVLPLGRREKVVLIESCGKKLLVGASSNSINTLYVFNDNTSSESDDKVSHFEERRLALNEGEQAEYLELSKKDNDKANAAGVDFPRFLKSLMSGHKHEP